MTATTHSSSMGATAAAVAIILAVGSSSTTSAFSPMISPQTTSMVQRRGAIRGNMPTPLSLRLPSLEVSNFDEAEDEYFSSAATTSSAVQEITPEPQEKKLKNPTPVLVSFVKGLLEKHKPNDETKISTTDKTTTTAALQLSVKQWAAVAAALVFAFSPIQDANAVMSEGRMGGSFSSSSSSAPQTTISRPAPSYSQGDSHRYTYSPLLSNMYGFAYGCGYGYGNPFCNSFCNPFYSPFAAPRVYYDSPNMLSVSDDVGVGFALLIGAFITGISGPVSQLFRSHDSALGSGTSVVQLSVALDIPDRDDPTCILGALDRLSQTARTDNRVGIQNIPSQVALEILRRRSSIVSAKTSTKHFDKRPQALREFENRLVRERSKFKAEIVSKFGGVDYGASPPNRLASSNNSSNDKATMVVVTLVLAIDGDSTKLNKICSMADVEHALQKIASDVKVDDCLQRAEILWTPEDRSETLSLRDVIADYPELRSI